MQDYELKKIRKYLNDKFLTEYFRIEDSKNKSNSAEIYFKDEFIGLLYKDDEDGEIAYQFHMTILDEDLLDS